MIIQETILLLDSFTQYLFNDLSQEFEINAIMENIRVEKKGEHMKTNNIEQFGENALITK